MSNTYRVIGQIGSGNMAEVYEAEHVRLGRRAAVKILRIDASDQWRVRFQREACALASLDDAYVVTVLDCGELSDGSAYLVMEHLVGEDMREYLGRSGPMPFELAAEMAVEACRGLSAVHAAGLVHRDLKPANLFLIQKDGRCRCKILDFGVAKLTNSDMTTDGALLGTVRYMAPEQLVDSASVTPQTDIYALGAVLYEAVAGRPPYSALDVSQLMFEILNREPPRLESVAAVPREFGRVVHRALARNPDERYASARALELALEPFCRRRSPMNDRTVADGSMAEQTSSEAPPRSRRGRAWLWWGLAGFALGLCFVFGIFRGPPSQETTARTSSFQGTQKSLAPKVAPPPSQARTPSIPALPPASSPSAFSSPNPARAPVLTRKGAQRHAVTRPSVAGMFEGDNPYKQ